MRPRIYLSGPITKGDRQRNFDQAAAMMHTLIACGYAVMNPMLSMALPASDAIDHATWIENDLPWINAAEAVYRLPGESVGADMECDYADAHGIPVYDSLAVLWAMLPTDTIAHKEASHEG